MRIKTVYGLREYLGRGRLSRYPRSAKQIVVGHPTADYLVYQCFDYMLIAYDTVECLRSEFPVKGLIRGHSKVSLPHIDTILL